jgi:hypothetical protein
MTPLLRCSLPRAGWQRAHFKLHHTGQQIWLCARGHAFYIHCSGRSVTQCDHAAAGRCEGKSRHQQGQAYIWCTGIKLSAMDALEVKHDECKALTTCLCLAYAECRVGGTSHNGQQPRSSKHDPVAVPMRIRESESVTAVDVHGIKRLLLLHLTCPTHGGVRKES